MVDQLPPTEVAQIPEGYLAETIANLVASLAAVSEGKQGEYQVEATPTDIAKVEVSDSAEYGQHISVTKTNIPIDELSIDGMVVDLRQVYDWNFKPEGSVKLELWIGLDISYMAGIEYDRKELWVTEEAFLSESEMPDDQKQLIERALSGVDLSGVIPKQPKPIRWEHRDK